MPSPRLAFFLFLSCPFFDHLDRGVLLAVFVQCCALNGMHFPSAYLTACEFCSSWHPSLQCFCEFIHDNGLILTAERLGMFPCAGNNGKSSWVFVSKTVEFGTSHWVHVLNIQECWELCSGSRLFCHISLTDHHDMLPTIHWSQFSDFAYAATISGFTWQKLVKPETY